jgi:steroid delta-isomerase-like uncharacterized protein
MAEASASEAIVRRFLEQVWNERKLDLVDEIIDQNCVTHQLRSGAEITAVSRGPGATKAHIQEWLHGFPDLNFTIEQILADDEKVFTQSIMEGMHTGPWMGMPPTHKPVSIRMMTVHRIAEGKIAEDWVLVESLGFFQQLGLIAPTASLLEAAASR